MVFVPDDEISGMSGIARFCTIPWLAAGGGGSPELPHAANTGETQSSATNNTSDLGMTWLSADALGNKPRFTNAFSPSPTS